MKQFLVNGITTGVGKSFVASSIVRVLQSEGIKSCGFKPSGSTTLMEHTDLISEALENGRLYGDDCVSLKDASKSALMPEVFGPHYTLILNHARFFALSSWKGYKENGVGARLLDRFTIWNGDAAETIFILNRHEAQIFGIESMFKLLNCHEVTNANEFLALYKKYAKMSIQSCYDRLARETDVMVLESRGNSASGWFTYDNERCYHGIKRLDYLVYVKPFEVSIYDGTEFLAGVDEVLKDLTISRFGDSIVVMDHVLKSITHLSIYPRNDRLLSAEVASQLKPKKVFKLPLVRRKDQPTLDAIIRKEILELL